MEEIFQGLNYNIDLHFNSDEELEKATNVSTQYTCCILSQAITQTGNENLINKITERYGFEKEYATILSNITFQDDYGSLSAKAIRKFLPYLKAGHKYDLTCEYAGYRHSASSLTSEELENKIYKDRLEILPKPLRNPVVEKILNQMIQMLSMQSLIPMVETR